MASCGSCVPTRSWDQEIEEFSARKIGNFWPCFCAPKCHVKPRTFQSSDVHRFYPPKREMQKTSATPGLRSMSFTLGKLMSSHERISSGCPRIFINHLVAKKHDTCIAAFPPRFCDFAMALALPRRAWAHQRCLFPLPRKIAARPLSIGSLTGFGGTAPSEKRGGARLGGIGSSSRLCTTSVQCILRKVYHNTPVFESVPPKKHTPFLQHLATSFCREQNHHLKLELQLQQPSTF